jgi:excinuclease ABC subunit C
VTIRDSQKSQAVVDPKLSDRDAWGIYREGLDGILLLIPVRKGMMLDPLVFQFSGAIGQDSELIATWLTQHYADGVIPREVLLPCRAPVGLSDLLSDKACRKIAVKQPARGDRSRLVSMATRNATNRFERTIARAQRQATAMEKLRKLCEIEGDFSRVECFDNSNIQGTTPVASQVVFIDGEPEKRLYRTYNIKSVDGPDDYASMAEVLTRRLKRGLEKGDLPDLIVVDGGRGQLNVALSVADDLGLGKLPIIGLSKPRTERKRGEHDSVDKIVLPWKSEPVKLPDHDPALNLLRRLRDESHRFAIQFHRKSRRKKNIHSSIGDIPGVGPSRRRALLRYFGSLTAIKRASVEELTKVDGVGQALANEIFAGLKS